MGLRGLVGGLLILSAAPVGAARLDSPTAGLVGLVSPAQVPDGPPGCVRQDTRAEWMLHAGPGTGHARIGSLRFHPWREDSGECDELQPRFTAADGGGSHPVPTLERGYEEPALLLLGQTGEWLHIDLGEGSGWLPRAPGFVVEAYPALLVDKLAYATDAWDGELCDSPATGCRRFAAAPEPSLRVLSTRRLGDAAWIEVELTTPPCDDHDPQPIGRGWIRSHDAAGRPTAWFHSRGC